MDEENDTRETLETLEKEQKTLMYFNLLLIGGVIGLLVLTGYFIGSGKTCQDSGGDYNIRDGKCYFDSGKKLTYSLCGNQMVIDGSITRTYPGGRVENLSDWVMS